MWKKSGELAEVKEHDMGVSFVRCQIILVQATREPRNGDLLCGCINVLVLLQVEGQSLRCYAGTDFPSTLRRKH